MKLLTIEERAEEIRALFGAGDGVKAKALEILNETDGVDPAAIAERIRTEFSGGESLTPKLLAIIGGGVAVTAESTTGIEPVTAEPEPVEPVTTEPEPVEPATTEPEPVEPVTTEPVSPPPFDPTKGFELPYPDPPAFDVMAFLGENRGPFLAMIADGIASSRPALALFDELVVAVAKRTEEIEANKAALAERFPGPTAAAGGDEG